MKSIGIITEYNPFHLGHRHQIEVVRDQVVQDGAVVAIMSGSFTQRGEIACLDKWTRARLAISNNVDLVLELPTLFCTASADLFAEGGVRSLASASVIGRLAFGSEAGDIRPLIEIAELLTEAENDPLFGDKLQSALREGIGYAAAMSRYVEGKLGSSAASLMKQSNNILGISYLKAIADLPGDSKLRPFTHERVGGEYLDSATNLRDTARQYRHDPIALMHALEGRLPHSSTASMVDSAAHGKLLLPEDIGPLVYGMLRRSTVEELRPIAGMNDGLAERLHAAAARLDPPLNSSGIQRSIYDRLLNQAGSRHLSQARVSRALSALLLGITEEDRKMAYDEGPQYLRVLAFNRQGRYILKLMSKYAKLPLITKASDFLEHGDKGLAFRRQYELDLIASDIHGSLCREGRTNRDFDTAVYIR